jgi:hypothetical protein
MKPDSVLSFYKRVLKLRRDEPAFREGKYVGLNGKMLLVRLMAS